MNLLLATIVSYQIATGLPLKHDGYVVEWGMGNGESAFAKAMADKRRMGNGERVLVVKAATERAFLYANYESNRWMNAASYPFVRDPHFRFRALDVSRSSEPLRAWIAATGANAVYLKRGRPDAKRLRECAELGVPAYGFLYGCDAAKWNRAKYDAFIAAHPSAKGVTPPNSWEKGTLCPSDLATAAFFEETILELVGCVVPTRRGGLGTSPNVMYGSHQGTDRPTSEERFGWLRAQLLVSRALDGALWRYFHLRACAKNGLTDAEDISGINADFETVRKHHRELCPGLGSPVALMRDIREKAVREAGGLDGTVANVRGIW